MDRLFCACLNNVALVTDFGGQIGKIAVPTFIQVATNLYTGIPKRINDRYIDACINSGNDPFTSRTNLVSFRPVIPEFTTTRQC